MKKSTLIVVILALVLGGVVYYREVKHPPKPESTEPPLKPVFSFDAGDITSLKIERPAGTTICEKRNGSWVITQPIETQADQSIVGGIATTLAGVRSSRALPAAADQMASYGLAPPAVTVEFQLKSGAKHKVQVGAKDFSGIQAYGLVDDSKDVLILPESLLGVTDRSLNDLRDRAVLDVTIAEVAGFDLKNSLGEIVASKEPARWQIEKPHSEPAADGAAVALVAQAAAGKMTSVVSETPGDLAKYGLQKPELTFELRLAKGGTRTLLVGKKVESEYYARDVSRPMIFRVSEDLYKKLDIGFADLRDKNLVHFEIAQLSRVEVRNPNQTVVCVFNNNKWVLEQPADNKGKEVQVWKFLGPLDQAQAKDILDAPPAAIVARLRKPAVEVTLTDKSGKTSHVSLSAESGGFVYARTNAGPAIYKLDKQVLDDLSFKSSEILAEVK